MCLSYLGMSAVRPNASSCRPQVPTKFVLRLGLRIRELHGLPDAEYATSKSHALRLFQKVRRISVEHEVKRLLQEDREGAFSLLLACMDFANLVGTQVSLRDIADAKLENTEWDRSSVKSASQTWFLMKAIGSMK